MSFSLNPLEFVKIMSERRKMSREQVIEWLESVRADGRLLAEAWTEIAAAFGDEQLLEPNQMIRYQKGAQQWMIAARLKGFHAQASSAIGGRIESRFWNEFMDRLGGSIVLRGSARAELDKLVSEQKAPELILPNGLPEVRQVSTMKEIIQQLQEQLAALDIFIQTIKAAPKAIR
jgi:hypothetical protein